MTANELVEAETKRCAEICDSQAKVWKAFAKSGESQVFPNFWVAESCALMILSSGKISDPRLEIEFDPTKTTESAIKLVEELVEGVDK